MHRTLLLTAPVLAALLAQLIPYYPLLAGTHRRTQQRWASLGRALELTNRALAAVPALARHLPAPLWAQYVQLQQPPATSTWEARMAHLQAARQLLEQVAEQLEAKVE
jgi:hypothetical protein